MVTRVTTPGSYSAVLANLLAAQKNQMDAGERVATQKNGSNLKEYARDAELLTAMRSVQSRLEVYTEQNDLLAEKLATQDGALVRIADAAQAVRQIMAEALATGRADTLVEDIEAQLRSAVEGMNARWGGKYLFAGGQVDTRPVTAARLSDLTVPPAIIADFFRNDGFKAQAKLDEATAINPSLLASEIGTEMLTAFQTFQAFEESASGPFAGALTPAQRTFLENQLTVWDDVRQDVTNMAARNGSLQQRVENVQSDLESRRNALAGMLGDITDADMARAAADLQQAQLSVQSAAYVFQALQESSLLNILRR